MTSKTLTRPLVLEDGAVVKVGMKLYSVSSKSICNYSKGERYIKSFSGDVASFIEEYTVVWVNERENSRSFKVKSGAGCEEQYSLKGCDTYLKRMDFSDSFDKAVAKAVKAEKVHLSKIEERVKRAERELVQKVKEIKEKISIRKKAHKELKAKIAAMPKTLKACKSC